MEDKLNYLFKFISYASYEKLINSKNNYLLELLVNNSRNVNLNCLYLIRYGVSDIEKVILTKTEDITKDHDEFIKDIKSLEKNLNKKEIISTQIKTIQEVNSNLIKLYFRLGKIVSENKVYGNNFTKQVSTELKLTFPSMKGFSERNIRAMRLFYEEYKDDESWQQLVAKLPWGAQYTFN